MKTNTREIVLIALFAALIGILGYISIPLPFSPVPITLQTFGVILAGLLLTPFSAFLSVVIWIAIGTVGAPVFANGTSGPGILFGPTGGYIFSFAIAAWLIAKLIEHKQGYLREMIVTLFASLLVVYSIGVPWLSFSTGMSMEVAFVKGCLPYIIGDVLKGILGVILAHRIRKALQKIS